ncbi:hypothetical protein QE379_002988 [Sphingomonas sp. SORGH_AS 879]|nr:hypothetical protein [Sphingomonas sp. SORGH_AS_0879]
MHGITPDGVVIGIEIPHRMRSVVGYLTRKQAEQRMTG